MTTKRRGPINEFGLTVRSDAAMVIHSVKREPPWSGQKLLDIYPKLLLSWYASKETHDHIVEAFRKIRDEKKVDLSRVVEVRASVQFELLLEEEDNWEAFDNLQAKGIKP